VAIRRPGVLGLVGLLLFGAGARGEGAPGPQDLASRVRRDRIESDVRRLAGFGTRHTASSTADAARGIGAARKWLEAALRAAAGDGPAVVETDAFTTPASPRLQAPTEIVNLWLRVPGTDPTCRDRVCVVSGHYDSRVTDVRDATADAPGANDDASGCAVVLEAARVFAAAPRRATILLAVVAGEEQGLFGSRHMAERLREQGVRVEGMITDDIVGNTKGPDGKRAGDRVRVFSEGLPRGEPETTRDVRVAMGGENDGPSRQLARFVRDVQRKFLPDFAATLVFRPDRFLRGGDHLPFNEAGYAAVRFTEPIEDFDRQHQDVRKEGEREFGDTADAVDYDYLARVARLNVAVLAALADAPDAPKEPGIVAVQPEHTTTLRWKAPAEDGIAGYEVVWRSTLAPDWEYAYDAGTRTEVTIPVEKDDVQFGIRTVGANGLRSPAAYPFPAR
jgi:hypothetical protein